jgi:hypothetical protein
MEESKSLSCTARTERKSESDIENELTSPMKSSSLIGESNEIVFTRRQHEVSGEGSIDTKVCGVVNPAASDPSGMIVSMAASLIFAGLLIVILFVIIVVLSRKRRKARSDDFEFFLAMRRRSGNCAKFQTRES